MGIINFLVGIFSFASKLISIFSEQQLKKEGAEAQSIKETLKSATIETKIAESEAKTDKSKQGLIDSAKKGEF